MSALSCGLSMPLLGRTQYCLGAVVLTLNITVSLVGLDNLRVAVTTSVNGPATTENNKLHSRCILIGTNEIIKALILLNST